jgi:hypothetical protein
MTMPTPMPTLRDSCDDFVAFVLSRPQLNH